MKINYRKIGSVLASAVMIGATAGFAAAANYPAPFVSGGSADVAIVIGKTAADSDRLAAVDIGTNLGTKITTSVATGGTITGEGDKVLLTMNSDKLNINNGLQNVIGTSVTDSDLPTLLADGTFNNKQNSEYKYTQQIAIGNLSFIDFSDSSYDDKKPTLGFQITSNTEVANYSLDFNTDPEATMGSELTDFENREITMLGKTYYILDFKNSTNNGGKITFLDSAKDASVNEGESTTLEVGGKSYETSIDYIADDQIILIVNGVKTEKLSATGTTYGNTYKLTDGAYVGIKNVNYNAKTGTVSNVDFSIGKGKLQVDDAANVKLNDKTLTDVWGVVRLGNSGTTKRTWTLLGLDWRVEEKAFLTPGKELILPGFEAYKFVMDENTIPAKEKTNIDYSSSDVMEIKTTIKSGEVSIPILYISTATGNITGIGKSATERLAVTPDSQLAFNATSTTTFDYDGFVVSWANTKDSESYYLDASVTRDSTAEINYATFKDKKTGEIVCSDKKIGETCKVGSNIVLTLNNVTYSSVGSERGVNMTVNAGGNFSLLYTKEGMRIYLPWYPNIGANGAGNITARGVIGPTNELKSNMTWPLWMAEEDKDGTLAQKFFTVNITSSGTTSYQVTVTNTAGTGTGSVGAGSAVETESSSKLFESYVYSDLATKVTHDQSNSNQYDVEIEYHGGEVYANVYLAAPSVTTTDAGSSSVVPVYDSEMSSANQAANLIVVGGSCINTVAAKLLGSTIPLCEAEFTAKTGVGIDAYLIETFASPYSTTGKIATLVAGYGADDTRNAAKALTTMTIDTTATKKYKGTTATDAAPV